MTDCVDLEIGIRRDGDDYAVDLRCTQPDSDTDVRSGYVLVGFDAIELLTRSINDVDYGRYLTEKLLARSKDGPGQRLQTTEQAPRTIFDQARSIAQYAGVPLRIRLAIGPNTPELHNLCWERLCDPRGETLLLTDENTLFSRYVSSLDWRPVRLRPKTALRALVVVANPDLSEYPHLAQVPVADELKRAQSSLEGISVTALASEGIAELAAQGKANLNNIVTHLRDGYDILYLVCHGTIQNGESMLWLESESGDVQLVPGKDLVRRLNGLAVLPRLVVLASCQSAGSGQETHASHRTALSALGPHLAEACIPAVVAMQGNVAMDTVAEFMPVFFRELQRDGQIDRAMAAARGQVQEPGSDWWRPALFMRLKSGRIWYTPGFADDRRGQGAQKWPALLRHIVEGRCTPILGPGLTESLVGSRREIAQSWADTYHFPMESHECGDLPQVAQYLAVYQDYSFPRSELEQYLRLEIARRYGSELALDPKMTSLDEMFTAVGRRHRASFPAEPHRILAELPLPIYITTNVSNMLADALTEAGKDPVVEICRWRAEAALFPSICEQEPAYRPTPERPLVYHLFGRLDEPDSVVLTEDDYFDYLIGVTSNRDLMPPAVRRALTDTAQLFMGFRMDDWNFRVFYRSIMNLEGRSRRSRYAHVAVQIDPEGERILEPERARRYLESYFLNADISIYWGSVEDFAGELGQRWQENAR